MFHSFRVVSFVLLVFAVNCAKALNCTDVGFTANCTSSSATTTNNETKTHIPNKPLNLMVEDGSGTKNKPNVTEKGRALNFTLAEHGTRNNLSANRTHDKFGDLSDVTIDDNEDVEEASTVKALGNLTLHGICEKGGLTYEEGESIEDGCESICTCSKGKMDCVERCKGPQFRKGKKITDPLCIAKEVDTCCAVLVCASDTETEPLEICTFGNHTYNRGESFNKGCDEVCTCEIAGQTSCKPRCPPVNKSSDRCVTVPDPNDSCCKKVLCDVTLEDHEPEKEEEMPQNRKILSAKYLNSTTVEVVLNPALAEDAKEYFIEGSHDQKDWKTYVMRAGIYVDVMNGTKYLRLEDSRDVVEIAELGRNMTESQDADCVHNGRTFKIGDEYNDNCTSLCACTKSGMKCLKLECPTYFGVDVLDPNCVEWETVPPNFVASPPKCCPDQVRCKSNGSCLHQGQTYQNWQQLPSNVTGCDKRCYCEMGNVECQNSCPPVTALPPPTLQCPPQQAMLDHLPEDDCCMYWVCNPQATATVASNSTHQTKNKLDSKKRPPLKNMTDTMPFGVPKTPSKNLGPLLIYANEPSDEDEPIDPQTHHHPNISSEENPFFHNNRNPETNYSKKTPSKPKPKPNKNVMFVTPPSNDNYIPLHDSNKDPTKDDILQFISQHPEIANYPSGSVLELHNRRPNPFINHNSVANSKPSQHQIIPFVDGVPSGVTLEHILQEVHRNANPNHVPYPSNHYNNGPVLIAPQSGQILHSNTSMVQGNSNPLYPGNYPHIPIQQNQDEINVNVLEALDPHTIKLAFVVPPVIVGLHGRVEVRYTHHDNSDINSWQLQVFAPPNDLIATPQLEFDLLELRPDTEYKIKITITLRDLHNTPTSRVYKIRTLKETTTTLPPTIPIEPELAITDINATWATVVWRKYTEYESQFIDGLQLRYKEIDGKIYDATPLIHRSVTSYTLENLKPNTKYEIGLFFIPFPGQLTELHAEHMLHFTTANAIDTYGFNVTLELNHIKSTSVEIAWSGVPYPEDKYVNIYRAIYQSDSGKEDHSTFKIAKRDSPTKTVIMELKPGTRYRLWLEVYLTNGKIKTSNVQDFITKPRAAPVLGTSSQHDKLSSEERRENRGDYYGPLVIVAILASIAILSTLILLLILVKRHNQNKAAITPPTRSVSQSAYDNPTYKVEIQQETMGM